MYFYLMHNKDIYLFIYYIVHFAIGLRASVVFWEIQITEGL